MGHRVLKQFMGFAHFCLFLRFVRISQNW